MIIKVMGAILKEFEEEAKRILTTMDLDVLSNQDIGYFRYLAVLKNHPNINQNDLAKFMNVNKGSVSKAVKFMLNHELVQRFQDEKDSRVKKLCLTDLGAELSDKFKQVMQDVEKRMIESFSLNDISTLNDLLGKTYENIVNDKNELLLSTLD